MKKHVQVNRAIAHARTACDPQNGLLFPENSYANSARQVGPTYIRSYDKFKIMNIVFAYHNTAHSFDGALSARKFAGNWSAT